MPRCTGSGRASACRSWPGPWRPWRSTATAAARRRTSHLDLRQAVHTINPGAFWHPTLNGEPAPHPLLLDNPFLAALPHGRWSLGHGLGRLPAPGRQMVPLLGRAARHRQGRRGDRHLGRPRARGGGERLRACRSASCAPRTSGWPTNKGRCSPRQPVIGLERIGDAPVRDFGPAERPFDGIRVLSFTHAVAGPTVGRTLAEQGADVLGATRPNDYEHEFIYAEANVGSRSAYLDLDKPVGKERAERSWPTPTSWSTTTAWARSSAAGSIPDDLADRHPGIVFVSVTCYGPSGPWARPGGLRHERLGRLGSHDDRRV